MHFNSDFYVILTINTDLCKYNNLKKKKLNCQWANNFIAFSRAAVEAVEGTKTEKNYQFNFVTQHPCAGLIPSPPPATHLLTPFNKKITPTHTTGLLT